MYQPILSYATDDKFQGFRTVWNKQFKALQERRCPLRTVKISNFMAFMTNFTRFQREDDRPCPPLIHATDRCNHESPCKTLDKLV